MNARLVRFLPVFLFAAVAAFFLLQTFTDLEEKGVASGVALYNAAFVPQLYAWILIALCLVQFLRILVIQPRSEHETETPSLPPATSDEADIVIAAGVWPRVAAILTLTILTLYVFVLDTLGYLLATPALVLCLGLLFGERNPLLLIVWAALLTLGLGYVFGDLFNVVLPPGRMELAL